MLEFAQLVSWKYSSGANYFSINSFACLIGVSILLFMRCLKVDDKSSDKT